MRRLSIIFAPILTALVMLGGLFALGAPAQAADSPATGVTCWRMSGPALHFEFGRYGQYDAAAIPEYFRCSNFPNQLRRPWGTRLSLHTPVGVCGYIWSAQFRLHARDDNEHRELQRRAVPCKPNGWNEIPFNALGVPTLENNQHPRFYGEVYLNRSGPNPSRFDTVSLHY